MKNQKNAIKILHVFLDEKFFDGAARFFMELPGVENLFYFYSKNPKKFKYIKNEEVVKRITKWKDYTSLFKDPQIDIIYFHSIPIVNYKLFKYIDSQKIVIWWCWGYDIYESYGFLKPFVNLELYKPLTKKKANNRFSLNGIYHYLKSLTLYRLRKTVLNRIDYFSPIVPIEYELMKSNPAFRAKPFMLESSPSLGYRIINDFYYKNNAQNIIIGNSSTLTNNHLDIFEKIRNIKLSDDRTYIIPINYGNVILKSILKDKVRTIPAQFRWLESFIARNEYKKIFQSITHAIFGHVRQQAMGNINLCLKNGIKIYLYRDSVIYQQLKMEGYHIYTIEDDLNEVSLAKVLSKEKAFHNYNLFYQRSSDNVVNTTIELQEIISQKINQKDI